MRPSSKLTKLFVSAVVLCTVALTLVIYSPAAQALPNPSFVVPCGPTNMAMDDPIVFPGQPGKSHMHTFYGPRTINASSTAASLLAEPPSSCGANFTMDHSGYWMPTLY